MLPVGVQLLKLSLVSYTKLRGGEVWVKLLQQGLRFFHSDELERAEELIISDWLTPRLVEVMHFLLILEAFAKQSHVVSVDCSDHVVSVGSMACAIVRLI